MGVIVGARFKDHSIHGEGASTQQSTAMAILLVQESVEERRC
jgi:hypothetical protein